MKEDFLHYLWRLKKFDFTKLQTTAGEKIQIQQTGTLNHNAGPDFINAKIQIGDTLWAGNVEMHLKSSEWLLHNHQKDKAYNNVILHVVLEEDQTIKRQTGEKIPCLELKKRVPQKLSAIYKKLIHNEYWIPCQHQLHEVKKITRELWLDRLMIERLEEKTQAIAQRFEANKQNWEETFYQMLSRNFGVKVNAEAFELLAKSVSILSLAKHKNNLFQLEALLFGQAGLLDEDFKEEYPQKLKTEYTHLRKKFNLTPIHATHWKFLRLRPANFPTVRIAQLAMLIFQSSHLFSKILAIQNVKEVENMFELSISNYWQTHYVFDKKSIKRKKTLGKNTIHLFVINTIVPFLFFYGNKKGDEKFKDKAMQLLAELPAEKNSIIKKWEELGIHPKSAYQSQALLQLKNNYCQQKKCLNCSIGHAILKG
ncbi:MAG TPA: DUF2851 family protein [Saprospiraceae bacterium]|nr:DUF2851 family protein [Saprospiraceae bacterium]